MKNKTKNFYTFLPLFLLLAAFVAAPGRTFGEENVFSVTPRIIDIKGKQKDTFQKTISLESRAERKLNIYAFVQNISSEKGKEEFQEPSDADHMTSLANWIAVTRGVLELKPNETREIEMNIEINLRAKPGAYHARIAFGEGGTRAEAEKKITEDTATLINLEVEEDIKEWLNLKKFVPKKSVFFTSPITFTYTLENSGNTPIRPRGKVFIYNKRGEEVGMLERGEEETIEPGGAKELVYTWEKAQGLGQLKAIVEIAYGEKNPERIQDTVFFWVIPWQTLAFIFGGVLAGAILLSLLKFLRAKKLFFFICIACVGGVILPIAKEARAEDTLTLTLTPPLFKINLGPGDVWQSSLKVVNINPYDTTLYATAMNFEAEGERGQAKFIPLMDKKEEGTLAEWIEVPREAIHIEREKSEDVPFTIRIPKNASPGGHYAAILVGTSPLRELEGSGITVSSLISSLLFVEVRGEVSEEGNIREFSTDKGVYQKPEAKLTLRFENTGNIHLQPKGEIQIFNMWGKERGKIPINETSEFGNVLPKSVRTFEFVWKGEKNFFEAGRYSAAVNLTYGKEARQHVSRVARFWIIPMGPIAAAGGGVLGFILLLIFLVRAYVKRVFELEARKLGKPIRRTKPINLKKYALVFLVAGGALAFSFYLRSVLKTERSFEIIIPEEQKL